MLALLIAQAYALSCVDGIADTNLDQPLPPNAVIVFTWGGAPPASPRILDADGEEVPHSVVLHDDYGELIPDAPLAAGDYVFTTDWPIPFEVAGPEDLDAPDAPVFLDVSRASDRTEWGTTKQLAVLFDGLPQGHHIELELSASGDFGSDGMRVVAFYEEVWVGKNLCDTFPAAYDHGENYFLRARMVDAAGNTSDWSEHEPARCGVGCSSTGAPTAGMLAVVGLLGLRRRRAPFGAILPGLLLLGGCPDEEEKEWEAISYIDEGMVCWEAADGVIELQVVVQDCMSSSCSQNFASSCEATVDGATLTLTSEMTWENDVSSDAACTDDCGIPMASCELADVADGTYTLDFDGETYVIDVPGTSGSGGCYW